MSGRIITQLRRLSWTLACLFWAAVPLQADTWVLANGDRVSGELVREDDQFIEIRHPQLGLLKLARAEWETFQEAKEPAHPGATAAADVALPANETSEAQMKPTESPWKRQVEVGFVQQSGSGEKRDLSMRLQVDGRKGSNTFRATSRLLRSDAEGKVVTDRREADFRWRYDLSKRLFTQALTNYAEDSIRQIDLSLEQQVGGGYRVLDSERHQANVGLGAVLQYLQREGVDEQTTLLGSFFQDYTYKWNSHVQIMQEANVLVADANSIGALGGGPGLTGGATDGNYRFKINTGMQSKVTANMSLNLRFEYDYDHSISEPDLRVNQRLTTSLGYVW